jgi:hypothetical protein
MLEFQFGPFRNFGNSGNSSNVPPTRIFGRFSALFVLANGVLVEAADFSRG